MKQYVRSDNNEPSTRRVVVSAVGVMGWTVDGNGHAEAIVNFPEDAALAVIEEGAISRAVGATLLPGEGQGRVIVEGLSFKAVTAWLLGLYKWARWILASAR